MFGFDVTLYAVSLAITFILAGLRLVGHTGNAYKAIAHCWVGFLFGAFYGGRDEAYWFQAWTLTGVEVLAFVVKRVRPAICARYFPASRYIP